MENNKFKQDLENLPLIFSLSEIQLKKNIEIEMKKVVSKKKYRAEYFPITSHFKSIIRF